MKSVQYMPVAEATAGCMSSYTKTELKIRPGPSPAIPEKKATIKAIKMSFKITRFENFWSPFENS